MGELFRLTHESETMQEYTSVFNQGGHVSPLISAALVGHAGLKLTTDSSDIFYGKKTISLTTDELRFRFYVNFQTVSIVGQMEILTILTSNDKRIFYNTITDDGVNVDVRTRYTSDDFSTTTAHGTLVDRMTHIIEIRAKRSSSPGAENGELQVWIDGSQATNKGNIDNFDLFDLISELRVGNIDGEASTGFFYFDNLILRDDQTLIGPATEEEMGVSTLYVGQNTRRYIGEQMAWSNRYTPRGFVPAVGQKIRIASFPALFHLISNQYGGDGVTFFNLPDLTDTIICVSGLYPPKN